MRRALLTLAALPLMAGACTTVPAPEPTPSTAPLEAEVAARAVHTMTPLPDGSLLVVGGCVVDGCATATATTFVIRSGSIARGPDLSGPRDGHTATSLTDGRVLVAGGYSGEGAPPLASAEVFDPATARWTQVGPMAQGRGGHAAALLGDGRVLFAGGWLGPRRPTATTEVFDPATLTFSAGPSLPVAADGLAASSLPDGCVLVVGGQTTPNVATDTAATVCPDLSVQRVGGLATGRFKHGIVTVSSGSVVVVGGTTDDRQLLASTEVYDAVSRTFRPGPPLQSARYKMGGSVVALSDDRVVVAGGGPGVEVLDLAAGSRRVDASGTGRGSFSTVGLSGPRVVVVGGYDEQIRLTRTFESFDVASL